MYTRRTREVTTCFRCRNSIRSANAKKNFTFVDRLEFVFCLFSMEKTCVTGCVKKCMLKKHSIAISILCAKNYRFETVRENELFSKIRSGENRIERERVFFYFSHFLFFLTLETIRELNIRLSHVRVSLNNLLILFLISLILKIIN